MLLVIHPVFFYVALVIIWVMGDLELNFGERSGHDCLPGNRKIVLSIHPSICCNSTDLNLGHRRVGFYHS